MLLVSFSNPAHKRFERRRMSEAIQALGRPGIDVLLELPEANRPRQSCEVKIAVEGFDPDALAERCAGSAAIG